MNSLLLFITGVLSGLIAGFLLSRRLTRVNFGPIDSKEQLLQDRLMKTDQVLEQLHLEREVLKNELRIIQNKLLDAKEKAAISSTKLEESNKENDALKENQRFNFATLETMRKENKQLSIQVSEAYEKLKSKTSQAKFIEEARADLISQFQALSGEMLDNSREALLKATKETVGEPFSKQVEILRKQVENMSKDSTEKLGILAQTTRDLRQRSDDVQGAAQQLTSALRSPNIKGRWGEVNLKRILEFVGLTKYCDFDEQVNIETIEGRYRPDCVITIPNYRKLIIDSKAPVESYLDAIKANSEDEVEKALSEHLKKVRSHIDQLSKKDYATKLRSLGQVIDGVILFIPIEGALSMALERDPELLEYAFSKKIILTFPTSLLAILKGFSITIQQAEIEKNIDEIQENAIELYKRFSIFTEKFNAIGSSLLRLNKSFNEAVGSYEKRLIPQGKKFAEMSGQNNELNLTDLIQSNVKEANQEGTGI